MPLGVASPPYKQPKMNDCKLRPRKGLGRPLKATRSSRCSGGAVRSGLPDAAASVGIINVMTLNGKTEELVEYMERKGIAMMGVSETKWKGKGQKELKRGYRIYWSGGDKAVNGVGIILRKDLIQYVEKVELISDRIIKVRLGLENGPKDFVQVYAPQTGKTDECLEEFLEDLEQCIEDKEVIIMGDMNAHVGTDRQGKEAIIGPFSYGKQDKEGDLLVDFCRRNGLIVGNTWFRKKNSQKITRYGWGDTKTKTMIDLFLVEKEKRRQLVDVTSMPRGDFEGDHKVVVAKLRLGKIVKFTEKRERKIKVWKLKEDETREKFQEELKKEIPKGEVSSVEEEWTCFKNGFVKCAVNTCGRLSVRKKEKETPWWNDRVKQAVKEKQMAWRKWVGSKNTQNWQNYKNVKKSCRKVVQEEKRKSWDSFTETLQKDESKKVLYGLVKSRVKTREDTSFVKAETGQTLVQRDDILERWEEYFSGQLNIKHREMVDKVAQEETGKEEQGKEISMLEIEEAIQKMKTGKAAGVDEVTTEMIRAAGPIGLQWLYRLFRIIWKKKEVPEEWGKGLIIPIFKKGDRKECNNYRGITLIAHVAKIFERVLEGRLRRKIEEAMEEEQYGFRKDRSTFDLIFSLRNMMEKRWEFGRDMVMTFIDIEKAYDSVPRQLVWEVLRRKQVNRAEVQMIKAMYKNCVSSVKTRIGETNWFKVETGLRQGSVLSPILFIIVMDEIHKIIKKRLGSEATKALLFADDIVIWGDDEMEVQNQVDIWNQEIDNFGMKISTEKSKTMVMTRGRKEGRGKIKLNGNILEVVKSFKYLGSVITEDGKITEEIGKRIQQANSFYQCVRGIVWNRDVPKKCKRVLYTTYYEPILTYAAGTWTTTKRLESRIQSAEMKFLRSIEGKTRKDRVRNEEIRKRTGIWKLQDRIETTKLKWYGHMMRMGEERVPQKTFLEKVTGKRPRGRPRKRWRDSVKECIEKKGGKPEDVLQVGKEWWRDRQRWRSLIHNPTQEETGTGK